MTYQFSPQHLQASEDVGETLFLENPRMIMFHSLPRAFQPFLTWLTAKPPTGEAVRDRSPAFFVRLALAQTILGSLLAAVATVSTQYVFTSICVFVLLTGFTVMLSGLGLFQVVIFHHCSHGTVFKDRDRNVLVGRLISAILLFKHFDAYKVGHMLHHNTNKLLTEEDEFADFVTGMCGLQAGMSRRELWRRVIMSLISPLFHARFLQRRIQGAWCSPDRKHNLIGITTWVALTAVAACLGRLDVLLVAWVLPVTVLLQVCTVFRILCEHRFPDPEIILARGRDFACHATAGVFAGSVPPRESARTLRGLLRWAGWWTNMLTLQVLVRLTILVGDAPCHDYHHRRPASRRWTSYIQARQVDVETNASGFHTPYQDVWGLFRAVDENLDSLARTPPGLVF